MKPYTKLEDSKFSGFRDMFDIMPEILRVM